MIKYAVDKHVVCQIGNLIAQNYGEHMVSLAITSDTDNGTIVKVGKMKSLDLYEVEAATSINAYVMDKGSNGLWLVVVDSVADDKTALVYNKPLISEESPRSLTSLANYYNDPADGAVRGYILHSLDRFWLSDDGFDGTPTKGASITAISNGKLKIGE